MKRLFFILIVALTAVNTMAENYPTKFLGIPIDGTKQEMIGEIQAKGFTYNREFGNLSGEFNGTDVNVYVVTNNNKTYRVMVSEQRTWSEGQIRIRFNNLMKQFNDNSKYIPAILNQDYISENEDISYEMAVHDKMYSARYLQITHPADTSILAQDAAEIVVDMVSHITHEDSDINSEALASIAFFKALQKQYIKNSVWFVINEFKGKYYISIYYDNEYNKANGEDL